jgi:hypothetical protein
VRRNYRLSELAEFDSFATTQDSMHFEKEFSMWRTSPGNDRTLFLIAASSSAVR